MNYVNLLLVRKALYLSIEEMCEIIGVKDLSLYSKYENGSKHMSVQKINEIAEKLKVSNRYFLASPTILNADDVIMYLKEAMEYCCLTEVKECVEIKNRKPVISFNPGARDFLKRLKNHQTDMDFILKAPAKVDDCEALHQGTRTKIIRLQKGISSFELCDKTGIHFNDYALFENNLKKFTYAQVEKIAGVLGVVTSSLEDGYYITSPTDVLQFFCQLILSDVDFEIDPDGRISFNDKKINAFLKEFIERAAKNMPYEFAKWWNQV